VKFNGSTLLPIAMLLMLAGLTLWLDRASQPSGEAQQITRHDPDYIVDNFTIKRLDAQGKLYQTLQAKQMRHYPDDDSTEADAPHMIYHQERKTVLSADKAWISTGGTTVQLEQNVHVTHENDNAPDTELRTSTLTVLPDEEIARTQAPVTITQGQTVIHGKGMESNNKTRTSVLGGRVQGTIAPRN
jgi:lipopolysaccharide export system protein LptC